MSRLRSERGRRKSLYDLTPPELESFFLSIGEKKYRAKQVLDLLYRHPVDSFEKMTTLPRDLRKRLAEIVRPAPLMLRTTIEAPDGSIKHTYELEGPPRVKVLLESVWMPAEPADVGSFREDREDRAEDSGGGREKSGRRTLCISSQLGCAAGCVFCATGRIGLKRQVTTGEIVYQVVHAAKLYGRLPDTVLFMGMGEPMHNFEAVSAAIEILTHPDALGISQRRIVVSTAGELERLGALHRKFPRVRLAISLNAATDDLRDELMPVNKRFNLKSIAAFISSIDLSSGERVTCEYVLLGGVNDTPKQEMALVKYLRPIAGRVKVNLIPFNPIEGVGFKTPERSRVLAIQESLREIGIKAFIRRNRGRGASAACGQLAGRL